MNFRKVFRGYDPQQVDKYVAECNAKEQARSAQVERIQQLLEENVALRQQVEQYKTDEQAISKSLVASQQLAQELKFDAEKYSELVLSRAKIFYATWRAYAQTLVSSLSPEEVRQFNALQRKLENVIEAYEGKGAAESQPQSRPAEPQPDRESAAAISRQQDVTPTETTMGVFENPISKVENAAGHVIDLRELTRPDASLEDLCADLGLIVPPSTPKD